MYITRNFLTKEAMLSIYYCLFYSLLTYGINIWGGACLQYLDRIYLVQKRFLRAITYTRRYERTTPLFNQLRILKFYNIRKLFLYLLGYKVFHQDYCNFIEKPINAVATRHNSFLLKIPVSNCKSVSHSAYFCVPKIWNQLIISSKSTVTSSNNIFQFKTKIKSKLFADQIE